MKYQQLNAEERSALAALRRLGLSRAEIGRQLGRHRSTVGRELKRNAAPYDGGYRSARAHQRAHARRYRSRRNSHLELWTWRESKSCCERNGAPSRCPGTLPEGENWRSATRRSTGTYGGICKPGVRSTCTCGARVNNAANATGATTAEGAWLGSG